MTILERANRTPVPPELFVEAMALFAEMPPEERSVFDLRTVRLADFLRAKGFSGEPHADLVVAITFRSFAIARLLSRDPVKGWIAMQEEETGLTRPEAEIIRAAAEEALVEEPGIAATFDLRSFARRILHVAQPQGRA